MTHTTGVLINTVTGEAVDAGVILAAEECIVVMHRPGDFNRYSNTDETRFAVLRFEFCPN